MSDVTARCMDFAVEDVDPDHLPLPRYSSRDAEAEVALTSGEVLRIFMYTAFPLAAKLALGQ